MHATSILLAAAAALTAAPAESPQTRAACRDTITQVRDAAGQPGLDRDNAVPGAPLLIAAVDKRIDNCRVLVMARDSRDIRPEPEPSDNRAKLRPAR